MGSSLAPLRRAWRWSATEWRLLFVLSAVCAAPMLLGVWSPDERARQASEWIGGIAALYAGLFATARVLLGAGAMPADYERHHATEARFLAALVAAVIFVAGVLLGLALLILPGVLLYLLWGLWMPAMLAERLRPLAALRRSWRLVRPHLGWTARFTLATHLCWLLMLVPAVPMTLVTDEQRIVDTVIELLMAPAQLIVTVAYAFAFADRRRDEPGSSIAEAAADVS